MHGTVDGCDYEMKFGKNGPFRSQIKICFYAEQSRPWHFDAMPVLPSRHCGIPDVGGAELLAPFQMRFFFFSDQITRQKGREDNAAAFVLLNAVHVLRKSFNRYNICTWSEKNMP